MPQKYILDAMHCAQNRMFVLCQSQTSIAIWLGQNVFHANLDLYAAELYVPVYMPPTFRPLM